MKKIISESDFHEAFHNMDRKDNFSYDGRSALYAHLVELEESTGEETELDVIALCCEYTEYENLEAFQRDHSDEYESIEDIEDRTTVIRIEDEESFIIQDF